jgi:hypothetical protein
MLERWKPISGYENFYEVSDLGRIKSLRKNKILSGGKDRYGYLQVILCKNGKRECKKIHQLVASAFVENPNNYNCVNHKDETKENNCAYNLEWCTVKYNINYGTRNQRMAKTNSKPIAQIKDNRIISVYNSSIEAQKQTGINFSKIRMCCRNERKRAGGYEWKEIKNFESEENQNEKI